MIKKLLILFSLTYVCCCAEPWIERGEFVAKFGGDLKENGEKNSRLFVGNYMGDGPSLFLNIGSPRKEYGLSMQTTDNQMWLINPSYPTIQEGQFVYKANESKSSIDTSKTVSGQSGTVKYSGPQYIDLTRKDRYWNQTFGTIQTASTKQQQNPTIPDYGLAGIAWKPNESRTNLTDDSSLILRVLQTTKPKLFTVWQGRFPLGDGQFMYAYVTLWGGILTENCSDISFAPLQPSNDGFALYFQLNQFQVGRYSTKVKGKVYADHSLPFIYVPDAVYSAIVKELKPEYNEKLGWNLVDCSKLNTSSNWIFTINGKDKVLEPSDFILDFGDLDNKCLLSLDYSHNLLTPTDYALGTAFLRAFCAIHDVDNNQIGFGKATHEIVIHNPTTPLPN